MKVKAPSDFRKVRNALHGVSVSANINNVEIILTAPNREQLFRTLNLIAPDTDWSKHQSFPTRTTVTT